LVHKHLAAYPYSVVKNDGMFKINALIFLSAQWKQQIVVPLTATQSTQLGNVLQKNWFNFDMQMQASILVEEVYAVWTSLKNAKLNLIKDDRALNVILSRYKKEYGKKQKLFEIVYNAFDLMAKKIGVIPSFILVNNVLGTQSPDYAFVCILSTTCPPDSHATNGIRWNLSPELTSRLANSTPFASTEHFKQLYEFFSSITDALDPDDSLFNRAGILHKAKEIQLKQKSMLRELLAEGLDYSLFYGSDDNYLVSYHDNNGVQFLYKSYRTQEGERVEKIGECDAAYIFNEAILQQLLAGIGLRCPFWQDCYPDRCCIFRTLLEKIWSCTKPDLSCKLWKPMGCLNKPHHDFVSFSSPISSADL